MQDEVKLWRIGVCPLQIHFDRFICPCSVASGTSPFAISESTLVFPLHSFGQEIYYDLGLTLSLFTGISPLTFRGLDRPSAQQKQHPSLPWGSWWDHHGIFRRADNLLPGWVRTSPSLRCSPRRAAPPLYLFCLPKDLLRLFFKS